MYIAKVSQPEIPLSKFSPTLKGAQQKVPQIFLCYPESYINLKQSDKTSRQTFTRTKSCAPKSPPDIFVLPRELHQLDTIRVSRFLG